MSAQTSVTASDVAKGDALPSLSVDVTATTIVLGALASRDHWISQMQRLAQECDYLVRALAHCRQRGMTPGVSVRIV